MTNRDMGKKEGNHLGIQKYQIRLYISAFYKTQIRILKPQKIPLPPPPLAVWRENEAPIKKDLLH